MEGDVCKDVDVLRKSKHRVHYNKRSHNCEYSNKSVKITLFTINKCTSITAMPSDHFYSLTINGFNIQNCNLYNLQRPTPTFQRNAS